MRVYVKNIEPCWVEYGFSVEVPDNLSDEEARELALEKVINDEDDVIVEWGPEVQGQIDSMDQDYEVVEVQR